ncbi:MAG: potassium channel protein [Pirellulaceae bacterium]|nr:potassium channel protein [Pirellulaceae bacterium]
MIAGWQLGDAIYMVVITIFGVGYGEVHPINSAALRSLTITVIIAGYASLIYTASGFMQMLIDGEFNRVLGARRMTKEIDNLQDHTIICGIGRLGTILAKELFAAGKPFVSIDTDERRLHEGEERGYLVLGGDATEEHVLEQAGIRRASTIATVLSDDATNVFVTITAREMNPSVTIIARGENPRTEKKLLGCGADQVVLPTAIGAHRVAQLITRPSAEKFLKEIQTQSTMLDDLAQIGLRLSEMTVEPDSQIANRSLREIEIRGNHGFLIVGIRHRDDSTDLNPDPDIILHPGDTVIVLGHNDDLPKVVERFLKSASPRKMVYRGSTVHG